MTTFDADLAEVKAASVAYTAIMMELANRETNTFAADHTADDEAWLASLNVEADAAELAPVEVLDEPGDWYEWGDDLIELGPEPTDADWDALMVELWEPTGFPNDWDNCPGGIG